MENLLCGEGNEHRHRRSGKSALYLNAVDTQGQSRHEAVLLLKVQALAHSIPDAVEVKGSDKASLKSSRLLSFSMGFSRALVTKPSIAGFGMNWQNCHKMIFVGLSDSYEQYYQAVRRCWRFGQSEPVDVYIVISAREGAVKANIERKQADCDKMRAAMGEQTREIVKKQLQSTCRLTTPYEPQTTMKLPAWEEFRHECA